MSEMNVRYQFTAIIQREGDGYVALCPEFDIASQGDTVQEARRDLAGALKLLSESASAQEVTERRHFQAKELTRIAGRRK